MNDRAQWLFDLDRPVEGLVPVSGYNGNGRPPEEVAMMEKAKAYEAHAVFFEAGHNGRPPVAQAFIFVSDGPTGNRRFAEIHKRLRSEERRVGEECRSRGSPYH